MYVNFVLLNSKIFKAKNFKKLEIFQTNQKEQIATPGAEINLQDINLTECT